MLQPRMSEIIRPLLGHSQYVDGRGLSTLKRCSPLTRVPSSLPCEANWPTSNMPSGTTLCPLCLQTALQTLHCVKVIIALFSSPLLCSLEQNSRRSRLAARYHFCCAAPSHYPRADFFRRSGFLLYLSFGLGPVRSLAFMAGAVISFHVSSAFSSPVSKVLLLLFLPPAWRPGSSQSCNIKN